MSHGRSVKAAAHPRRWRVAVAACLVTGIALPACAPSTAARSTTKSATSPSPSVSESAHTRTGTNGDPVRLRIPALRVAARVLPVGLDRHKRIVPPGSARLVGWWKGGAQPGKTGPTVLVGHLDTVAGPAVFAGLGELRRGDAVTVERSGGRDVTFQVRAVRQYPQNDFPDAKVYGPTANAQLRLITCAGSFDRRAGHYRNNMVVFAEQERTRR